VINKCWTLRCYGISHFEEPDIIPEERIKVELLISSVKCPTAMDVSAKNMDDPMLNFFGHLKQIHVIAAASGTLHLNFIAVILMEPLKALYEQEVYRQPCNAFIGCVSWTNGGKLPTNWATPVGVTTKHSRFRLSGPITDFVSLAVNFHAPRTVLV
jgi:hypothetical protein